MPYLPGILRIGEDEDAMSVYIKLIIIKTSCQLFFIISRSSSV